jgi:hypothetical protein
MNFIPSSTPGKPGIDHMPTAVRFGQIPLETAGYQDIQDSAKHMAMRRFGRHPFPDAIDFDNGRNPPVKHFFAY